MLGKMKCIGTVFHPYPFLYCDYYSKHLFGKQAAYTCWRVIVVIAHKSCYNEKMQISFGNAKSQEGRLFMRKMNVLGVELKDYSVKESMKRVLTYLNNGSLDTVCFLTTDLLLEAKDNQELKTNIEEMNMTIPSTVDILQAGETVIRSREKEVESNLFLRELLKRLAREKRKIFLIAETEDEIVHMRETLLRMEDRLVFFGSYAYEMLTGTEDVIINEINNVIPDVIFSRLDSPKQEKLVCENQMKVNAKLWVAFQSANLRIADSGVLKTGGLHTLIDKTIFKRIVNRYENDKEE